MLFSRYVVAGIGQKRPCRRQHVEYDAVARRPPHPGMRDNDRHAMRVRQRCSPGRRARRRSARNPGSLQPHRIEYWVTAACVIAIGNSLT